mmetsp:Transcript_34819/g.81297  ORF Transcript_34819/g.81297 Transcript_34819/m.81297 type:complete len:683 (+) Transcript_34819:42-2090(+)
MVEPLQLGMGRQWNPKRHRSHFQGVVALLASFALVVVSEDASVERVDGPVIGIDLGTTFSCVAVYKNGQVDIIANDQGNRVTPSYVAFDAAGEKPLVGEAAKNVAGLKPGQTIFDVKRVLGLPFKDPRIGRLQKSVPFTVVEDAGSPAVKVSSQGKDALFKPEQISAMVLGKLKEAAEKYLEEEVKHAVIAVPAHFNEAQRQATKTAAAIAGLNVLRLVGEPTAAAVAYGLQEGGDKTLLVYDLGGGTLDISLLKVEGGVFRVLATAGDEYLGGEDFNQRVVEHYVKVVQKKHNRKLNEDPKAMQKLRADVEKAKCRLSFVPQVKIDIEAFDGSVQLTETLTRARFEEMNKELFERSVDVIKQVLQDGQTSKDQVDEIVLTGGSARIPKIQQLVKAFLGGKELSKGLNPDEAVAYGAAIQGKELSKPKSEREVLLVDVIPLTLGIELAGGVMAPVIARNTQLPCENSTVLSTFRDNQPGLRLKVYEGERLLTKNNHLLGSFKIADIPPAPKGQPQIEVTFSVDADGIVHVKAEDRGTGVASELSIGENEERLGVAEVERMLKEAEEFADADIESKEKVEAKLELEQYMSTASAILDGTYDQEGLLEKLDEEDKQSISTTLLDAKDWIASNADAETEEIKEKYQEVEGLIEGIFSKFREAAESGGDSEGDEEAQPGSGSYDEL